MKLKTNFGMVVSGHKEATKAGIKILKKLQILYAKV